MKRGKEKDGENHQPLFPRLSINDRESGGPRPPPRNKMALYEQVSIPSSRRFDSSTASPPPRGDNLVTSSSSQGYRQHRSTFAPSDVPAQPSVNLGKRVHPQSSDGMNLNSTRMEFGRSSKRQANNAINITSGSAGCSQQAPESSNAKKSCQNNIDDSDDNYDCMVPTFLPSRISPTSEKTPTESRRSATSCTENPQKSSSSPSTNFSDKLSNGNGTYTDNMMSKYIEQNHTEPKDPTGLVIEGSKRIQDYAGTESVSRSSSYENSLHPKYCSNGVENEVRRFNGIDVVDKGDDSNSTKGSCSEASLGQNAHNEVPNHKSEHKSTQLLDLGDRKRNEVTESSLPDSVSAVVISPDDVVGAIGPKHFWKARRAIVNQQRIFAIQVFELHRLIKVQKLIAASPEVLKVDIYLNQSPPEVPTTVMPPENPRKSFPATIIDNSSQNINDSTEHPQDLSASDNIANPWCFHPNINQWLIPVMSPSEGLIYKPYPGPCPPGASYMPPFCGNSAAPMSIPIPMLPVNSYSYSYQQPEIYFPSYGLSNTTSMNPSSVVEQVGLKPASDVISTRFQKSEASKSSHAERTEFAGPGKKARGGTSDSNGTNNRLEPSAPPDNQHRVIRVVPRNARLATESAARIFRSIQEERKQRDS